MFTNNYLRYKKAAFMGKDSFTYIDVSGASKISYRNNKFSYNSEDIGGWMNKGKNSPPATTVATSGGVYFGSGSTPATKNDYTLEAPIESGVLTITSPAEVKAVDGGNGRYTFISDFIVRNDSDTEVNIWEIGLFSLATTSANSETHYLSLMERTVLTEPITIPAGESRLVTYKLTFNQTLSVD